MWLLGPLSPLIGKKAVESVDDVAVARGDVKLTRSARRKVTKKDQIEPSDVKPTRKQTEKKEVKSIRSTRGRKSIKPAENCEYGIVQCNTIRVTRSNKSSKLMKEAAVQPIRTARLSKPTKEADTVTHESNSVACVACRSTVKITESVEKPIEVKCTRRNTRRNTLVEKQEETKSACRTKRKLAEIEEILESKPIKPLCTRSTRRKKSEIEMEDETQETAHTRRSNRVKVIVEKCTIVLEPETKSVRTTRRTDVSITHARFTRSSCKRSTQ